MLQNLSKFLTCIIFLYFLWMGSHNLNAEVIFQKNDHCLAYQTEETIFLLINSIVIGKTCEISTQVEREAGNTRFLVSFPISSLDSGLEMRDDDVTDMLTVESNTDIRFVSDFLTEEQILAALSHGKANLWGMLEIRGKFYKVMFPLMLSEDSGKWLVTGNLVTSFSKFGIELPSVLGGVIADTRDQLELLVHLRFNQEQGLPDFNQ
mgnify:FL=1